MTFVWDLDADRPLYVNGQTEPLLGCTPIELMVPGEEIRSRWLHLDEREKVASTLEQGADGRGWADDRYRTPRAKWRGMLAVGVEPGFRAARRENGARCRCSLGLMFDVTARRAGGAGFAGEPRARCDPSWSTR